MALLVSKRLGLLIASMVVEILLGVMFLLMYTERLYTTWDHTQAIYLVWASILCLVISGTLFYWLNKQLKEELTNGNVVEATLLKRQQLGRLNRKVIIWTYTYKIDTRPVKNRYWHMVKVRDLEVGDRFSLVVNHQKPMTSYFFIKDNQKEGHDNDLE